MSTGYQGEIRMFGGTFAPYLWTFCHGQLLSISTNSSLFSLLGTAYGGDGRTSFAVPDLRGRGPMHQGQGPALTNRVQGSMFGTETESLTINQIPAHKHTLQATTNPAITNLPIGNILANVDAAGGVIYHEISQEGKFEEMEAAQIQTTGSGLGHENRMPSLAIQFIMCLQGTYPSRN